MKVAIYGQYYQNTTSPIVERLLHFLEINKVDFTIEANFLQMLQDNKAITIDLPTFSSHTDLDRFLPNAIKCRW